MGWKRRLAVVMMSVAFLAILVCPAAAQSPRPPDTLGTEASARVRSFTDNQGIIHITNRGAAQPPKAGAAPAPVLSGAAPQALLNPQPEQASARVTEPPPPAEAQERRRPMPGQAEPAAAAAGPQGMPGGAAPGKPEAGEGAPPAQKAGNPVQEQPEEAARPALPLRRVSLEISPGTAGMEQSRPPAPRKGNIRVYRDAKGVLRIENVEPAETKSAPAPVLEAAQKPGEALALQKSREESPLALNSEPGLQLPLKRVSYSLEDFLPRPPPGPTPSGQAPALMDGAVRRYRDAKGVFRIENVEPAETKSAPAPVLEVAQKPGEALALQKSREESPLALNSEPGLQLPLKKVSYSLEDFLPRPPPGPTPSGQTPALMDGAVRRYRDGRGILHIDNPGAPEPERPPPRPVLAAAVPSGPPGYTSSRLWREMEKDQPPTPGLSGGKISAFRDRQGRLVIRGTDEGQRISPGLPPGLALASLDPHISEAAQAYGLPIPLVLAVVKVESNFVPWAVSPKGAMGLMQLMPGTATFLGVRDPFNPRENLLGGCRYLRLLLDCFNGSLPLALAAYNAGYQRVIDAGFQIPPIKETQEFVTRILGIYYQSLNRALRPAGFT